MNLSKVTSETDQLEVLCQKIKALHSLNTEILEILQSHYLQEDSMVPRYEHTVTWNLSTTLSSFQHENIHGNRNRIEELSKSDRLQQRQHQDQQQRRPYTLQTHIKMVKVSDLMNEWRYEGEPLESNVMMMGHMNLHLTSYHDIGRLMNDLKDIFLSKHPLSNHHNNNNTMVDDVDPSNTRKGLRTILSNMERLQVALGELQAFTMEDRSQSPTDEETQIHLEMTKMMRAYQNLSQLGTIHIVTEVTPPQENRTFHETNDHCQDHPSAKENVEAFPICEFSLFVQYIGNAKEWFDTCITPICITIMILRMYT